MPDNPRWQDQAACAKTYDPAFFPLTETPAAIEYVGETYCNSCPARVACLGYALKTKSTGAWAGTSTDLRVKLRKTRARVKCPSCFERQLVTVPAAQICLACGLSWPVPKS